jgi:purine-nucleoside phosphorylase
MAIRDHLIAMRPHWWRELNRPSPYSRRLLGVLGDAASAVGQELPAGVYGCVTGPNYETSAEVRGYQAAGADAVGMSTAHEANAAAALGMEVAAVSCIANLAAGISPRPLSHTEVLSMVRQAGQRMAQLVIEFLRLLSIQVVDLGLR